MKADDTINTANTGNPATDGNSQDTPKTPVYRTLGESGLVEDEDGNILSASEIEEFSEPQKPASSGPASSRSFGVASVLDDKANPAYWHFYYDPRYCGPDPEAYMAKMARQYSTAATQKTETVKAPPVDKPKETPTPPVAKPARQSLSVVPEAAREKADREQEEVRRLGLRPTYRKDFSYNLGGLNFTGIVNRDGTVVISNKEYTDVGHFYNGLARAQKRKTKKFGFVDRHGNEVIPCVWQSAGEFSEYMAGVQNDNRRCGYVDVTGRLVIPCVWVETWPFHEGMARVQGDYKRIGMIDQRGKLVIPCVWQAMGDFSEGLAGVRNDEGKCGYIDTKGRVVIPCRWKQVWTFSEGLAVVQDFNKRLGFIDKSGELVIPCRWKKANYFRNGLAKVSASKNIFLQDKWVYIDKQGRVVK